MTRRFAVAAAFSLTGVLLAASVAGAGGVPGARSLKVCAGAGPYWPTETLAIQGTTAWIACKERLRVVKFDLARGRTKATAVLDGPVIAVTTGFGSVWALDSGSTLYRIDPRTARVRKRIALGAQAPYNIWVGAGAVWVVDDGAGQVIRVSPGTNREVRRIVTGDGPADMVFQGTTAWVINHRDRGLVRLDTRTNKTTRLATLESVNAAP